jgi:hypothetical protein
VTTLLGGVSAYTVLLVLLIATVGHLASPTTLPRAVAAHGVLPGPAVVGVAVTLAEAGLVVAGALAVSTPSGDWLRLPVFAGSALLFAGYGGYSQHVRAERPGTPCGCSTAELPVTGWVVTRAYLLAGVALLAAGLAGSVPPLDRPGLPLAVTLLAAAGFATLLWHLPTAMYLPSGVSSSPVTLRPATVMDPAAEPGHHRNGRQLREGAA